MDVADLNIVLHVGTLLSIIVFYWQRIRQLLVEDRRTIGLLILGTIPGVAIGVPVEAWGPSLLESPLLAGVLLVVTGIMLLLVSRRPFGQKPYTSLSPRQALTIGLSQAAAILPGLSRSGATISTGLVLGLSPQSAATFSFLLALPIIAGGGMYKILSMLMDNQPLTTPPLYLLTGAAVAFAVGLVSLSLLVRWLEAGRWQWFAWWCIPLGVVVIVWRVAVMASGVGS